MFFSVFWDLYCAAPERRDTCEHSSEAKAFHDYVSINSCSSYFQPINTWLKRWQRRANIRVWPGVIVQFGIRCGWNCLKHAAFCFFFVIYTCTFFCQCMQCFYHFICSLGGTGSDNLITLFSMISIYLADILTD